MCHNSQKAVTSPSPVLSKAVSTPASTPAMEYGVDDVLGDSRTSDGQSVSNTSSGDADPEQMAEKAPARGAMSPAGGEVEKGLPAEQSTGQSRSPPETQTATPVEKREEDQENQEQEMTSLESNQERTFTLPFRQGGFFRTWLMSFFVVDNYSVRMYPNEKRNERKRKEILLCDASVQVGPIERDKS